MLPHLCEDETVVRVGLWSVVVGERTEGAAGLGRALCVCQNRRRVPNWIWRDVLALLGTPKAALSAFALMVVKRWRLKALKNWL